MVVAYIRWYVFSHDQGQVKSNFVNVQHDTEWRGQENCSMGLMGHQKKKNFENNIFHLDRYSMCIWCKASALHIIFHAKGKEIEPHYNTLYFNNNEPDQPENLF